MKLAFFVLAVCAGVVGSAWAQSVSSQSFRIKPLNETCAGTENKKALKYLEEGRDRKNEKERRVEALRKAIEEDPDCAEAHYLLGLELLRTAISQGTSFGSAESELRECVRICPDFHFEPYYYLGSISLGKSLYQESVNHYKKYYELSADALDPLDDKREEEIKLDYEFAKFFADAYANPVPFAPVQVSGVCTEMDEFLPLISPDNESMLLTRRFVIESPVRTSVISEKEQYVEKFIQAGRQGSGFEEGEALPSPFNENPAFHYGGASLTIDNKHIFLTICRPASMGYNNCDIYTADLHYGTNPATGAVGYYWSPLRSLGDHINTEDGWEAQPSVSSDGKTLYFASARADSKGIDIYYSQKNASGEWGPAINIGPPINTDQNEKTPFMHSDSRTLYFSSDGHLGFGGYDVFFVRQEEGGGWGKPQNLGHPINTPGDEQAFVVSTDGKRVYYSAKDKNNPKSIDIWNFELYKEAQPDQVVFVKGQLRKEDGEVVKDARIQLKTMQSKTVSEVNVNEEDGKYAAVIPVQGGENVVMNVKAGGMAFQSKLIETVNEEDMPKHTRLEAGEETVSTFQEMDLKVAEMKEGGIYRINDIYYGSNSAEISEKSKAILDEFADYLKENNTIRIAIHGHTDDVGQAEDNLVLSADRAFSVKQYLESKGIEGKRIEYRGFGETTPFTSNDTAEGRALNRRTEFVILSK